MSELLVAKRVSSPIRPFELCNVSWQFTLIVKLKQFASKPHILPADVYFVVVGIGDEISEYSSGPSDVVRSFGFPLKSLPNNYSPTQTLDQFVVTGQARGNNFCFQSPSGERFEVIPVLCQVKRISSRQARSENGIPLASQRTSQVVYSFFKDPKLFSAKLLTMFVSLFATITGHRLLICRKSILDDFLRTSSGSCQTEILHPGLNHEEHESIYVICPLNVFAMQLEIIRMKMDGRSDRCRQLERTVRDQEKIITLLENELQRTRVRESRSRFPTPRGAEGAPPVSRGSGENSYLPFSSDASRSRLRSSPSRSQPSSITPSAPVDPSSVPVLARRVRSLVRDIREETEASLLRCRERSRAPREQ
ncbi:unnamed protein product [Hydatigera taeniaeformis]|uniref:UDENN domain-containing protein n=1 Tax=Hydatigena taeniaeformis TaxID=6205 RepID=A0A0R3X0G7_HYDTA|nr:unnamed protein product [Hydatigera taeniaeformis]